jgi:hypothetical protein
MCSHTRQVRQQLAAIRCHAVAHIRLHTAYYRDSCGVLRLWILRPGDAEGIYTIVHSSWEK